LIELLSFISCKLTSVVVKFAYLSIVSVYIGYKIYLKSLGTLNKSYSNQFDKLKLFNLKLYHLIILEVV